MNTSVTLKRRPKGKPVPADFDIVQSEIPEPRADEVLVENLFISLDAGFRNWMDADAGDEVLPAMALGKPVMGLTVSRVIASNNLDLPLNQLLMGRLAWQSHSIAGPNDFLVPLKSDDDIPLSYHLGILGDTGMSAYFGLIDIAQPRPGDTVVISAAAGAVGYVAGQVARILGATNIVGFTSSDEKAKKLIDEVGYDAVINHATDNIEAKLAEYCPNGIDIYFDNVGGPLLEHVLNHINEGARIPFCGAVADYTSKNAGPSNLFKLVTNSARLQGFMTHHNVDRYFEARNQLKAWLSNGDLTCFEQRYEGVSNCGVAFSDLFAGKNFGKSVVQV
ncbi:MAG: NADPH-dependent curcumin reductase CurA [Candidatus Azotimanducaceae bacterium]|jgi:NADPH-dependent curcumin reductase CurA